MKPRSGYRQLAEIFKGSGASSVLRRDIYKNITSPASIMFWPMSGPPTAMRVEELVELLGGGKQSGDQYTVCCPVHDDRKPSLSVREEADGKVLVHCFNGCDTNKIMAAVGLTMSDLFNDDNPPGRINNGEGRPFPSPPQEGRGHDLSPICPDVVERLHQALPERSRQFLKCKRMLSDEIIDRYKLGYEERRVTIPVADEQGDHQDIRRYLPPEERGRDSQKLRPWEKGRGKALDFPSMTGNGRASRWRKLAKSINKSRLFCGYWTN